MEVCFDHQADALYIKLRNGKFAKNKVVDDDTILDYDYGGNLLGVEMLSVSRHVPAKDLFCIKVNLPIKAVA